ncbi:response regulator transcription factor [Actinomycetospora endophytica]|uniref:Response regulator transcription factor n=1 Tax=Actinomycetospora endophytica TaxID=2291215 RepID=A0ABS8P127_9PSEU|nr:response regulator transcription factor [Actinomycetospora endophytica]MCD2191794.1 response regulator transcription factor [Actinomycetospora endophytica]
MLICEARERLRERLAAELGVRWLGEPGATPARVDVVDDPAELVAAWLASEPDLVVVGAGRNQYDTLAGLRALLAWAPQVRVLVAGATAEDHELCPLVLSAGARGYLALAAAPGAASDGTPAPDRSPPATTLPVSAVPAAVASDALLSQREAQVLVAMSRGETRGEIAAELSLSPMTVKTHTRRLFRTLGVRCRAEAVAAGFRRGLLS